MARHMTKVDFERYFKDEVIPQILSIEADQSGRPDRPLRRESWNNMVDAWIQDGELSERAYDWSHPSWLETCGYRGTRRNGASVVWEKEPGNKGRGGSAGVRYVARYIRQEDDGKRYRMRMVVERIYPYARTWKAKEHWSLIGGSKKGWNWMSPADGLSSAKAAKAYAERMINHKLR